MRGLGPAIGATPPAQVLRAAAGGAVGLLVVAVLAQILSPGSGFALPLGASAVLIFALPNSPLAQPWSVVIGNTLSALIGGLIGFMVPHPVFGPALAFALAILVMMSARALHPPGGAMAVSAALAGAGAPEAVLWIAVPVVAESLALVATGMVWHLVTGRVYPFRQPAEAAPRDRRLRLSPDDLRGILARYRQAANIGVEDLARLIDAAESEAAAHRFEGLTVAAIMTPDVVSIAPGATVQELARLFEERGFTAVPVVGQDGLAGMVTQAGLIRRIMMRGAVRGESRGTAGGRAGLRVADLMRPTDSLPHDAALARLLPLLARDDVPAVPVLRGDALVGIVTRSDLLALFTHELATGAGMTSRSKGRST